MAEQPLCSCAGGDASRIIFPCGGQANTGQISNQVAIQLEEEGYGKFSCTTLLISSEDLVKKAASMDAVIAIDGCDKACARKIAEKVGVPVYQHLLIPNLGVEKKTGDRSFTQEEVESIVSAAWKGEGILSASQKGSTCSFQGCRCTRE
nr:putative zinc-binding protein [uncultured Methanospirillum sp.]